MSPKYSQVCSHIKYNHIFHCLICLIKTANVLVSSKSIICQARGFPRRKERGRNRVLSCACLPVLSIICQVMGFQRQKECGRNRVLSCACVPVLSIICQARGFPRRKECGRNRVLSCAC